MNIIINDSNLEFPPASSRNDEEQGRWRAFAMLHKPAVFQGDIPQHIPTNGVWIGLELLPLQIGGESLIRNNVTQRQWRDFWNRRTKSTAILLRDPFGLDRK